MERASDFQRDTLSLPATKVSTAYTDHERTIRRSGPAASTYRGIVVA